MEQLGVGFTTIVIIIVALYVLSSIKILAEYERGVIFRLGRLLTTAKGPGVTLVFSPIDRMVRVSLRQEALEVPPQDIITRDNVTLKVNAVIFFGLSIPTKPSLKFPITFTRLRSSRRPRYAQYWGSRSSMNYWRTAKRSTSACRPFSTSTLRPGA